MRVTVCQWPEETRAFTRAWEQLAAHVTAHRSELVSLPQMPFSHWFATSRKFDPALWKAAVEAHDAWESRLPELGAAAVVGTRPVDFGNERYNTGFVWEAATGSRAAHAAAFLANEKGAWEATWYRRAYPEFTPAHVGDACIGFLICTELWAMEQARIYGEQGVHLLVTPRATSAATLEMWLAGGRVAAVLAGAFGLSSNRVDDKGEWGGQGWVVGPDAEVLALTDEQEPFVTVDLDLACAERAKKTYPRSAFAHRSAR
jgi:N-carbamoylputrescine amidase